MSKIKLFDKELSRSLKEAGIEQAASNREKILETVKIVAKILGKKNKFVTADDVASYMFNADMYDAYTELGNARGAIFRGPEWKWTGEFRNSTRIPSHANPLRVWEYVG